MWLAASWTSNTTQQYRPSAGGTRECGDWALGFGSSNEHTFHYGRGTSSMLELLGGDRRRAVLPGVRKDPAAAARRRLLRGFQLAAETHNRRSRAREEISWKLHPDNFERAPEAERQLSLECSSQLNDAYRTLRDPVGRVEYLLGLAGMRREGQHKQQAPPELLEEVFELNESLDELREARQSGGSSEEMAGLEAKLEAAQHRFESSLADVDRELARVSSEWDEALEAAHSPGTDSGGGDAARKKLMERMNEILNRRSYIRNLVNSVRQELAGT